MSAHSWFDVQAELRKLEETSAQVGEQPENFSRFSDFSVSNPETLKIKGGEENTKIDGSVKIQGDGSANAKVAKVAKAHAPWICPHCGQEAIIEDIFPSLDEERTLTMWRCDPCQVVAVTPDGVRQPPRDGRVNGTEVTP